MESTDREILLEINGRVISLEAELRRQREEFSEFRAITEKRLDNIEYDLRELRHDNANLSTFMYWILGAIGIFIAAVTLPSTIASIRTSKPEKPERHDIPDIVEIARQVKQILDMQKTN